MNSSSAKGRADGAHAAGVETGVALADALVVFSNREHAVATVAVGEDEYGAPLCRRGIPR